MIEDILFEPIRKLSFQLQKVKTHRWYSQTHTLRTAGKTSGEIIYNSLIQEKPVMISRMGTSELHIILNYLSQQKPFSKKIANYLNGTFPEFWWGKYAREDIHQNSGLFSVSDLELEKFSRIFLECLPKMDVLLTWLNGEYHLKDFLNHELLRAYLYDAEPYFDKVFPWTQALEGKKVLVIHPFENSIQHQYKKRHLLFEDKRVLPDFELKTVKAFQTIKGNEHDFKNWFEALDILKDKINQQDFDIALIGAGAYGLPLAAHVKSIGKKGVHLGGFLQMLFGITGSRWRNCPYHKHFINEHWKIPFQDEYPGGFENLDQGSYW